MSELMEPQRISRAQFVWLERQAAGWRDAGIVDDHAIERIFGGYDVDSPHRRGMMALIVLAALMVGIGVLLVIGYNWARIGPMVKVGMTMTAVAAAFGAAALAFARRHDVAGETLALIGTFAYANSIWLIAQVLHIQGHFPDGFMWSAVGALAAALIVGSRWIGIEAAIFALAWIGAAAVAPPHDRALAFLLFAPAAIAIAYRLQSPVMLRVVAFGVALWVFLLDVRDLERDVVLFAAAALAGCAFYAIGALHRQNVEMRRAWQSSGLVVLIVLFPAFLTADFHQWVREGTAMTSAGVAAIVAAAITSTLALRRQPGAAAVAVTVVAGLLVVWAVLTVSRIQQPHYLWVTIFSILALLLSTSLIHTALRTDDVSSLSFGILLGLVFIVVRWTSVIENMLWSGLMLLVAGAGLFLVARLWRNRDRQLALSGRMS
jgi:uncharacterized membrane protein